MFGKQSHIFCVSDLTHMHLKLKFTLRRLHGWFNSIQKKWLWPWMWWWCKVHKMNIFVEDKSTLPTPTFGIWNFIFAFIAFVLQILKSSLLFKKICKKIQAYITYYVEICAVPSAQSGLACRISKKFYHTKATIGISRSSCIFFMSSTNFLLYHPKLFMITAGIATFTPRTCLGNKGCNIKNM